MINFDHNATTPMLPQARQAWLEAAEKFVGNPSSPHRIGGRADAAITAAREELAGFLGCDALDIIWTSGATESNNTVLYHFARTLNAQAEAWVSAIEHPCVLEATKHYFPGRHRLIPATHSGVVDLNWLVEEMAHQRPGFVAIMAANNETGVLQPWREALAICRQYEVPFFCDAAQWIGKLPAKGVGECDFVSGAAHKFGGPKGVGFLKCPHTGRVEPLLRGGPQEEGRRAGTENVAGILSLMAALEAREASLHARSQSNPDSSAGVSGRSERSSSSPHRPSLRPVGTRCGGASGQVGVVHPGGVREVSSPTSVQADAVRRRVAWRDAFEQRMLSDVPGSEVVGAGQERLWNTVSALMPEADSQQRWVVKLDKLGYAVSTGSACSSGKEHPSHVLAEMGFPPRAAGRVLRFSSGWETTDQDWNALLEGLQKVYRGMTKIRE
jgi:cysteine sulfinate desulfinase/cysteine desulfurase-like protein